MGWTAWEGLPCDCCVSPLPGDHMVNFRAAEMRCGLWSPSGWKILGGRLQPSKRKSFLIIEWSNHKAFLWQGGPRGQRAGGSPGSSARLWTEGRVRCLCYRAAAVHKDFHQRALSNPSRCHLTESLATPQDGTLGLVGSGGCAVRLHQREAAGGGVGWGAPGQQLGRQLPLCGSRALSPSSYACL